MAISGGAGQASLAGQGSAAAEGEPGASWREDIQAEPEPCAGHGLGWAPASPLRTAGPGLRRLSPPGSVPWRRPVCHCLVWWRPGCPEELAGGPGRGGALPTELCQGPGVPGPGDILPTGPWGPQLSRDSMEGTSPSLWMRWRRKEQAGGRGDLPACLAVSLG